MASAESIRALLDKMRKDHRFARTSGQCNEGTGDAASVRARHAGEGFILIGPQGQHREICYLRIITTAPRTLLCPIQGLHVKLRNLA